MKVCTTLSTKTKVLIVDAFPVVRWGLTQLIKSQEDLAACGDVGDAKSVLPAIMAHKPGLVLMDIALPDENGVDLIRRIHAAHPDLPILVISINDESLFAERALRAGARGYIMKDEGEKKLLRAIRRVLSGSVYLSGPMSSHILHSYVHGKEAGVSPLERLTDREFEIFQRIGQGQGTRQIANELKLSVKTVDTHRAHLKEKLNLSNGSALVHYAVSWYVTRQTQSKSSSPLAQGL